MKWTSGTITYETFTAAHPCSLPDADKATGYPYGTLLEFTDIYYADDGAGNPTERGQIYVVQKTSTQYSRKVLGVYGSDMLARAATSGPYANNLHSTEVLGDGHILCNGSGGNIKVGDGICASATAGIGQKADKLCMIIGIAQKDITFSGSENILVPVQYGLQQFTPWLKVIAPRLIYSKGWLKFGSTIVGQAQHITTALTLVQRQIMAQVITLLL